MKKKFVRSIQNAWNRNFNFIDRKKNTSSMTYVVNVKLRHTYKTSYVIAKTSKLIQFCNNWIKFKIILISIYNAISLNFRFRLSFSILYKNWKTCKRFKYVIIIEKFHRKNNDNFNLLFFYHNNMINHRLIKIIFEINNTIIITTTIAITIIIKNIRKTINIINNRIKITIIDVIRQIFNRLFKRNNVSLKNFYQNKFHNKNLF